MLKHCYEETNGKHRFKYVDNDSEIELKYGPKDKHPKYILASELVEYISKKKFRATLLNSYCLFLPENLYFKILSHGES